MTPAEEIAFAQLDVAYQQAELANLQAIRALLAPAFLTGAKTVLDALEQLP